MSEGRDSVGYDQVNKPKHYNVHPSGVECLDVNKHMGYSVGNAYKYLFRNEEKHSDPFLDLRKALQYIRIEIAHREEKEALDKITAKAVRVSEASPKYQGDALFELWLAELEDGRSGIPHLQKAAVIVEKELDRRASGGAGPDR